MNVKRLLHTEIDGHKLVAWLAFIGLLISFGFLAACWYEMIKIILGDTLERAADKDLKIYDIFFTAGAGAWTYIFVLCTEYLYSIVRAGLCSLLTKESRKEC